MKSPEAFLRFFIIVLFFSIPVSEAGNDPDTQLNTVYKQLMIDHKGNRLFTSFLKNVQIAWIHYRDSRADLEALIVGKGSADSTARKATIDRLTEARVQELKHIAMDGLPADFHAITAVPEVPDDKNNPITQQYSYLREQLIEAHATTLLEAWLRTSTAWIQYANQEALFDSKPVSSARADRQTAGYTYDDDLQAKATTRLDQIRLADMTRSAVEMGLAAHPSTPLSPSEIVDPVDDQITQFSGDKKFRIEFRSGWQPMGFSNLDNSSQLLADGTVLVPNTKALDEGFQQGDSEVYISSDSHWIFQLSTWFIHVADTPTEYSHFNAHLFEVIQPAPLKLKPYFGDVSFAEKALRALSLPLDLQHLSSFTFSCWQPDSLKFEIDDKSYVFNLKDGAFSTSHPDPSQN